MLRFTLFIFVLLFIASCERYVNPSDRIVTFYDRGNSIGHGYDAGDDTIITATHVVDICTRKDCSIVSRLARSQDLRAYQRESFGDTTYLRGSRTMLDFVFAPVHTGQPIYTLVSRSGSWMRIDGKIMKTHASYIGYDETLSGIIYTGAIETDIVLERGESGSPLWDLSGGLIGVMSAVDKEGKRGWVVR